MDAVASISPLNNRLSAVKCLFTLLPLFPCRLLQPVNLPGLASTRGVKLQKYRKFDDVGLILCSSTRLEDVPCADSFSVEDTLVVSVIF